MNDPGPWRRWVLAARIRTLPAAAVPVAIGASLATPRHIDAFRTLLCFIIALTLQIATNFANDYSDGVRGTDADRVGPFRITASKLVEPVRVKQMAMIFFVLAMVAGLILSIETTWLFIPIGAVAVAAGWFYTGGPRPYGYMGLGELFVLIFFGYVATVATAFAQHNVIPTNAWWWGLSAGSMACALLEANNMRDISGDRESGKKTLAARLGRRPSSYLYALWVLLTALGAAYGGAPLIGAIAIVVYIPALQLAFSPKQGRELLGLLKASARAQLLVGASATLYLMATR